jgi:hypothetical protein
VKTGEGALVTAQRQDCTVRIEHIDACGGSHCDTGNGFRIHSAQAMVPFLSAGVTADSHSTILFARKGMKIRGIGITLRNAILAGNVESLSTLANPWMTAYYHAECRFLYKCLFPKAEFTQKPVWEMFGADRVPMVLYSEAAQEWFRPVASYAADLVSMCMLCQLLKPRTILEIGTFHGAGALHWAANAPDAEVYTLDLPASSAPGLPITEMDQKFVDGHAAPGHMLFEGKPEAKRIHLLFGDSAVFDFSPFFGRVDLLFIDGSHSYEYVRNDTLRGMECCSPGSVIAWHDYGRVGLNGVSMWLHEFSRQQARSIYRVPGGSLAYTRL